MNINNCVFSGNLGRDVELKQTNSGKSVASASIAVTNGWGDNKRTSWVRLVAWEKTAEILEKYCKKGDKITVVCEYQEREYESDGKKKYSSEFIIRSLELPSKNDRDSLASEHQIGDGNTTVQEDNNPLPF